MCTSVGDDSSLHMTLLDDNSKPLKRPGFIDLETDIRSDVQRQSSYIHIYANLIQSQSFNAFSRDLLDIIFSN